MAAKLVGALKFLDVPTGGWTRIGLVYTGDVAVDVRVVVRVDVCAGCVMWYMHAGGVDVCMHGMLQGAI